MPSRRPKEPRPALDQTQPATAPEAREPATVARETGPTYRPRWLLPTDPPPV